MRAGSEQQLRQLERWAVLMRDFTHAEGRSGWLAQELDDAAVFMERHADWWNQASSIDRLIALEILLLRQPNLDLLRSQEADLHRWIEQLRPVEEFYWEQGGLIGYQAELLHCLHAKPSQEQPAFLQPPLHDLQEAAHELWSAIRHGLEALPLCAEIYPAGGAGDRLGLRDPERGHFLPVALLPFDGKTLLEGMIDDLYAREWLYFRVFGQQVTCPIAMMVSDEKDNHRQLQAFCSKKNWFGRGQERFRLFKQPLVPVIQEDGTWLVLSDGSLMVKPGGHGVIWKLMQDQAVVEWLFQQHASLLVIRQVNNPLAGSDRNLLALVGIGLEEDKVMGFASCPRVVGAAEGMNVVKVLQGPSGNRAVLTNVEYTDFQKVGWRDEPVREGSSYSAFPSNTNILYLNLQKALAALNGFPIPGLVLNLKPAPVPDRTDKVILGRLESTMQNLADFFPSPWSPKAEPSGQPQLDNLQAFATQNRRDHTLSAAKKAWQPGGPLLETPQGAYLDLLRQRLGVLRGAGWEVPEQGPDQQDPCCLVSWHPALGPLHSLLQQRLKRGRMTSGSSLNLQVADAILEDVDLQGGLWVEATAVLGKVVDQVVRFGPDCGQIVLRHVSVRNQGPILDSPGWNYSGTPTHQETCRIILQGASRFTAQDVIFRGDVEIVVRDGEWVEAIADDSDQGWQLIRRPWAGTAWCSSIEWSEESPKVVDLLQAPELPLRRAHA